jgi:hypothetical protein
MDWLGFFQVNPFAAPYVPGRALWRVCRRCEDGLVPLGQVIHNALYAGPVDSVYARRHFNEAGDLALLRERTPDLPRLEPYPMPHDPEASTRTAGLLQDFAAGCRRRGIAVYLAMPAFPRPHYDSQAPVLEQIQALLRARVSAPILVAGREATLPPDRFYDTDYHLTTRGAAERSDLLGRRLAQALGRPEQAPDAEPYSPQHRQPLLSIPTKK